MGYTEAVNKSWKAVQDITDETPHEVLFLSDVYDIDLGKRRIVSRSSNAEPKEYTAIIILHYLFQKLKNLPAMSGEWISFRQLAGGEGYYPVFKKRVIDTVRRKCDDDLHALIERAKRFDAKKGDNADMSLRISIFPQVPILVTYWMGDDEFESELNILFDRSIERIFCTEDIVVISEIFAYSL